MNSYVDTPIGDLDKVLESQENVIYAFRRGVERKLSLQGLSDAIQNLSNASELLGGYEPTGTLEDHAFGGFVLSTADGLVQQTRKLEAFVNGYVKRLTQPG